MDLDGYWTLVEKTRPKNNDAERHIAALERALKRLPAEEIVSFEKVNAGLVDDAYRADLWDMASANNGLIHGRRRKLRGRFTESERGFRRKYPMAARLLDAPPEIDPAWLMWGRGTVKRIARAIQAERRWADLPVLADALEDAGCADDFLLGHLREGRRHARHCWALYLLLRRGRPG